MRVLPTRAARTAQAPLLGVRRLSLDLGGQRRLREIDFNLLEGERLGILAPAGAGKSLLARVLVGLARAGAGSILYEGRELAKLGDAQWHGLRRQIQLILQDAPSSLDLRRHIAESVAEPLRALYPAMPVAERAVQAEQMLERVGLPRTLHRRRPSRLSPAQCVQVALARTLVLKPRLLIWDEPAAADAAAQGELNRTLRDLQAELGFTLLVLTRSPQLVRELSSRALVMWHGRVMESGDTHTLFTQPMHPCTRRLLAGPGELHRESEPLSMGCVFRPHCPLADPQCAEAVPVMRRSASGSFAACHHLESASPLSSSTAA